MSDVRSKQLGKATAAGTAGTEGGAPIPPAVDAVVAGRDKRVYERVVDVIGGTPLVRLHRFPGLDRVRLYAKLEFLNPGGSVKDRIAAHMLQAAEAEGKLRPGGTVIEPTAGNTGIGLAMACRQAGYKCI